MSERDPEQAALYQEHCRELAREVPCHKREHFVVNIGSADQTLLRCFEGQKGANISLSELAMICEGFKLQSPASLVTALDIYPQVMDVMDWDQFFDGVGKTLVDDGTLILEIPSPGATHTNGPSTSDLGEIASHHGLYVKRLKDMDYAGGTIRLYFTKEPPRK